MLTFGFYNSVNGDRKYNAEQMSAIFDGLIKDGVFATIGNAFNTTPGSGLEVIVDTGKAWFNHTWNVNDSMMPLKLSAADIYYSRIDAVVLEINKDVSVRANAIKIIEGTPDASPERPTLIKEDPLWQYPLAYITVDPNATNLTAANIEKMVGQAPCPFVTGVLETIDITELFTKWEGDFKDWFSHLKIELSGDVAGNLQRQIDELSDRHDADIEKINAILDMLGSDKALIELTVKTKAGNPLEGVIVTGMDPTSGSGNVVTNKNGVARGYIVGNVSTALKVSGYTDLNDGSVSVQSPSGKIAEATLELDTVTSITITSTKNTMFSKNVKSIGVFMVGGGGGGASASAYATTSGGYAVGGGGGGGGTVINDTIIEFESNLLYSATVGSGGKAGSNGGDSTFMTLFASGGTSGTTGKVPNYTDSSTNYTPSTGGTYGGGNGAIGKVAGVDKIYIDVTPTAGKNGTRGPDGSTYYGSGGGAGGIYVSRYGSVSITRAGTSGGTNAGKGASDANNKSTAGTANTGSGGGGGAGSINGNTAASAGGSGIIILTLTLKNT